MTTSTLKCFVELTAGSAVVTLTAAHAGNLGLSLAAPNVVEDMQFVLASPINAVRYVKGSLSTTSLELQEPWNGATASSAEVRIGSSGAVIMRLVKDVEDLLGVVIADNAAVAGVGAAAQNAVAKAGEAAASAQIALDKAGEASASAGTASAQAGIATTKAGEALGSAGTASAQAGIATTKAGEALGSAGIASAQAGIATAKAGEALGSAGTASAQAGIATTKAGEATASAIAAAASAASAAAGGEPAIAVGAADQFWAGDKTWKNFALWVRSAALTGISFVDSAAVVATDVVLVAIGKLQAQITAYKDAAITFTNKTLMNPVINGFTGSTAVVNIGGGQVYKDANGKVGVGTTVPGAALDVMSQINVTNNSGWSIPAVKGTNFGYSSSYRSIMLGAASGGPTLAIGYDPSVNSNGSFQGDGREIILRNGVTFMTPNAANTLWNLNTLVLRDGNVLVGKNTVTANAGDMQVSKGIAFPGTQVPCSDPNTFDDYEEGTWTPTQGAGLTVVGTFSSAGTYTKKGREVTVIGYVFGTTSVASASATVMCAGLPFASATNGIGVTQNGSYSAVGACLVSGTSLLSAVGMSATTFIYFTATYFV